VYLEHQQKSVEINNNLLQCNKLLLNSPVGFEYLKDPDKNMCDKLTRLVIYIMRELRGLYM
jgi:hypothetical protein